MLVAFWTDENYPTLILVKVEQFRFCVKILWFRVSFVFGPYTHAELRPNLPGLLIGELANGSFRRLSFRLLCAMCLTSTV